MTLDSLAVRLHFYSEGLELGITPEWVVRASLKQAAIELRAGALPTLPTSVRAQLAARLEGYVRAHPLAAIVEPLRRETLLLRLAGRTGMHAD